MPQYIVTRALSIGEGRTARPGETLPVETAIPERRLAQLVEQGYLQAAPDAPGSAGAALVADVLAAIDALPIDPSGCDSASVVGRHYAISVTAAADRAAIATRLEGVRAQLEMAKTTLAAADEHANFTELASTIAALQVLPSLVTRLERELRAAEVAHDAANREIRQTWLRAQSLALQLKTRAMTWTATEIEQSRSEIERLIGWPTVDGADTTKDAAA